jgi:hypothetical protein
MKLYDFPNNYKLTTKNGTPYSDSTIYFPVEIFKDTLEWENGNEIKNDSFSVRWYSKELQALKEPILFNQYLGKNIYRFTWLRSFHEPIILRIESDTRGNITLIEKKLYEFKSLVIDIDSTSHYKTDSTKVEELTLKLSKTYWDSFEQLLFKNNFLAMSTTVAYEYGTDGSEWILEKHCKDGYYVVNRWAPDNKRYSSFRNICDYLIDLSNYKNEERY